MINYDIGTVEGMGNARAWLRSLVSTIKQDGIWMVPRSMSQYRIDHQGRRAIRLSGGEACIEKVFEAMGWKVVNTD